MTPRSFDAEEAQRTALREEAQQRALNLEQRLDRLISGMTEDGFRDYLDDVDEGHRLDARIEAEKWEEVVRLSRKNRGET